MVLIVDSQWYCKSGCESNEPGQRNVYLLIDRERDKKRECSSRNT